MFIVETTDLYASRENLNCVDCVHDSRVVCGAGDGDGVDGFGVGVGLMGSDIDADNETSCCFCLTSERQ